MAKIGFENFFISSRQTRVTRIENVESLSLSLSRSHSPSVIQELKLSDNFPNFFDPFLFSNSQNWDDNNSAVRLSNGNIANQIDILKFQHFQLVPIKLCGKKEHSGRTTSESFCRN